MLTILPFFAARGGGESESASPRAGKGPQLGSEGEQLVESSGGITLGGVNSLAPGKSHSHDASGSQHHTQHPGSAASAEAKNSTAAGKNSFVVRGRGQDSQKVGGHHGEKKGSTEWEVAKDDSFFDNIDK